MADTIADRYFWQPHSNPRTVWVLPVSYLLLLLALYRRDRPLGAATLLFVAAHLFAFSPLDALLIAVGAPLNLFTLRAAVRRQPGRLAVGAALSLVFMFVFFGRMARHYDTRR